MLQKNTFLLFAFALFYCAGFGQTNFRTSLQEADPLKSSLELSHEERLLLHQAFLEKAQQEKNPLHQLYGMLYLFYDNIRVENFTEASRFLLEAKSIAEKSNQPGWQGWVNYRSGLLYLRTKNFEKALEVYEKGWKLCAEAGDSLCMGESLEQLSAINGLLGNYENAHQFFNSAMPLLEKYGEEKHVATANSNYGSLLSMQGKPADAIPYIEKAIRINDKLERNRSKAKAMNNLANVYHRLGQNDKAIDLYKECIAFNNKHQFSENRVTNYMGIYLAYEAKGDFKTANEFLNKRFMLKDSIIGAKTQLEILELEAKYQLKENELVLQASKTQILEARQTLERRTAIFFLILSIISVSVAYRWSQSQRVKAQLKENKENLDKLAHILFQKNSVISNLDKQFEKLQKQQEILLTENLAEENIFNQRILTKEDWEQFKAFFEKTYPGYLRRLRIAFSDISEAEERLFLIIKLNLNTKEAATILGISIESVKKTRNRLRKRLGLNKKESLEKFIHDF